LAGAVPGVFVGVSLLKQLDPEILQRILGVVLIVFSLFALLAKPSSRILPKAWAYPFGFLSGCLGGAISAAGPPVIVYTALQPWRKNEAKVTLQGFFLVSGLWIVSCQALSGLTSATVLRLYGAGLPMLVLGTYVGSRFYNFVREEGYRKIILILLGILGIFMSYSDGC
jgi:hypothetical protein